MLYNYMAFELHAPGNAMGQYNRIAEEILTLEEYPDSFGVFDSEPEHSMGIHRMVVDNFLVCYVIDQDVVTVIDVLYGLIYYLVFVAFAEEFVVRDVCVYLLKGERNVICYIVPNVICL